MVMFSVPRGCRLSYASVEKGNADQTNPRASVKVEHTELTRVYAGQAVRSVSKSSLCPVGVA